MIHYFHSRTNPRVTVAGKFEGNKLHISAARCSKKDQFEKKKGRLIALGRLNKGVCSIEDIEEPSSKTFVNIAKNYSEMVASSPEIVKISFNV